MKKFVIIGIVILVVVLIIIGNIVGGNKGVNVYTNKVARGNIISYVSAPGNIISKNQVNISSQVMGKVVKINVEEGDRVRKGDTLAILDDFDAKMNLQNAKSAYMSQKASYEYKKSVFEKQKSLYEKGYISEDKFRGEKLDYENAYNSMVQLESQYKKARKNLEYTRIISPINGTVISVKVKEGETVIIGTMNNPGTVLFTVADLEHMQMDALFDESDIPDIRKGMKARVVVAPLPDDTFKAVVTEVASAGKVVNLGTREEVVNFEVKADIIGNSKGIKNGMGGNIDIITKQKKDVLKIPLTAIQKRLINGKFTRGVFIYKNEKAHFKQVKTGISGEDDIEVTDGLKEGDIIISGPYSKLRKLKDGDRVKLMKRERKHGTVNYGSKKIKRAGGE